MELQPHATLRQPSALGWPSRVVPFVRHDLPNNELLMRDRIELLRWTDAAHAGGWRRVALHHREAQDDPETVGDFVLVYGDDPAWAEWGVARSRGRYLVWRPASGRTIGEFATLLEALETIYAG